MGSAIQMVATRQWYLSHQRFLQHPFDRTRVPALPEGQPLDPIPVHLPYSRHVFGWIPFFTRPAPGTPALSLPICRPR